MSTNPSDQRFILHYEQGMLRSAFRSMFWAIIAAKKSAGTFSLKDFIALLPRGDKGKVSKWFNGDPNWTINTIGTIANALNVEITIQARDRTTGVVYTPAGVHIPAKVQRTRVWRPDIDGPRDTNPVAIQTFGTFSEASVSPQLEEVA